MTILSRRLPGLARPPVAARLLIAAALCWGASAAKGEDKALTLYFDLSYNGIQVAEAKEVVSISGDTYRIESFAAAQGLAKMLYGDVRRESAGAADASGLRMTLYSTQRGDRPRQMARRDSDGALHLSRGEESRTEEPQPPLFDYLTALYNPYVTGVPPEGFASVTDGWRLREYEYIIAPMEEVETPAGTFQAVPVRRESPRGPRIFWLAPDRDYIPIKVYVDDKGHAFETILTGINEPPDE